MASTTPDIMVGFDSDEGASMNKLSQIIEMLRKALFGVIYVMSKETSSSRLVIVSGSLMQFFQILGFAFNRDRKFPLHPQAASALLGTLPFFTIAGWKHSSAPTKGGAIFALALCTVILVLACAVYVGYSFVQNSFKYMFPLKILRQFAVLITSIGFIPIATIFIQNIRCEIDSNVACYIGTNMNTLIFLIPLSIMFVIFCFIVQLTYFEDDPCKPSVMGRCHSRAEVLALIMRFLLTAFWELLPAPKYNLFIIVAMTLLTFLCAFVYTWYLPFYRLDICEIKSTLSWMQCWAAIAVTVAVLNDDISDPAPVVAFYIGIPIVVIASNLLLKARKIWIRDTPVQKLNSAFEVQLKAHLLMIKVSDAWMDTGKKDAVSEEEFNNVCRQSEEVYLDGVKKFSNSSLVFLFRVQFYLTVLKNTHTVMRALSKASERSPQLDEKLLIYRRRKKKSEESTGNSNNDIITSIAYEQYLKDAIDNDWNAAISQIRFWEDIQIASINIEELNDLAANVSKYLDRAQQNYLKMLKMAQRTPTALKTYAGFLSDLLNEKESAAKILNQAEEAQHNAKQGNKLDGTSEGGLQGGVVVVSGEDGSIGVITKTNDYLCKILGYSRNELLGKNISILVPDPWKSPHHSMIQSFLESGNSLLTKRSRRLFAEHKDGTLIPGVLIIRENNESDEMMEFMAIFSTLEDPLEIDTNYVILELTSSGAKAIGWTRGCKYLFAKTNFLPENVNILSWMPFFNEIKSTSEPFIIRASPAPAVDIIQSPTWNKNAIYNVEISIEPRQIEAGQYGIMRIVSQHQLFTEVFAGHIAHELLSCQDGFEDMPESVIESLCHDLRMLPSSRRERIFELASKQLQDRKTALQILEAMHEDANLANAGVAPGQALSAPENPNEKQDSKEELDDSNDDSDSVTKVESTVSTKKSRTPAGERAEGDTNDNDGNFRHLLSNSNASSSKLLPQLKYVRRLLFVGLLTSVITVIGSFVFFNSTIAHYTASSSLLTLASERPFHSLSIVFATQWLLTMNAGIESIDQISNAKQMLSTNAQSLKDFNRIIRDNQQDVSKQFLAMEQDISVSIVTSFQGSSQTPIEKASPISATASLADAASKLYTTDLQLISVNNSDVKFIVEVQSGDLISHLESSTDVWRREILDNLSNIQMIAALFSTAAIVLLFLLIAVFVVPAMQTFKSNQYRGLMVFTQVPVNEIEMLRKRSLKRLRDLRAARSELFAVSDHDDFTHEDDIRQSHSSDIQASHRNLKELAARKRSVALGWKLSLKLFSLVLTLLAFVAIVFAGIGQSTLISSMANNVAVQTWSQFRRMKVREVLLTLQVFGAPLNGTSFGSREHQYLSAMAKFDELNKIDYDLTYGSSSLSLPGVFYYSTLSDTEALLTFEDGCMLDSMKVTACDTIQQGLLTNGLRVAVNQFSSQSRSLVASLYTDHIPKFDPGFQMNVFSTLRELERSFLQPSLQYGILLINTRLDDSISV